MGWRTTLKQKPYGDKILAERARFYNVDSFSLFYGAEDDIQTHLYTTVAIRGDGEMRYCEVLIKDTLITEAEAEQLSACKFFFVLFLFLF